MLFRKKQAVALRSSRQLVVLFAVLIVAMVVVTNAALALAWIIGVGGEARFPTYFFTVNTVLVLFYILGSCVLEMLSLKTGGESLAKQAGGRELDTPQTLYEKRVCNVVMEVAVATGMRPPRVFLLAQEDAINAFAAGWDEKDAVIAITRGSMERLTRDELQGIVAHEFSHILNGDMRLNMRLMGMVLGLQMLYNAGGMLVDLGDHQGKIPVKILFGYAFIVAGWMGWLAGRILCASVSRQREFLADASAVEYTRLVEGIGGALRKIAYQQQSGRGGLQSKDAQKMAPLFLHFEQASRWLATHPPISERLKCLDMPYKRFEAKDDIQEIQFDEFLPNRLVADFTKTPHLKIAAARWGGVENKARRIFVNAHIIGESADVDVPPELEIEQTKAELYLEADLTEGRLKAAVLAFWVPAGQRAPNNVWEHLCQSMERQVPFRVLASVQNLAPKLREPMFERLVAQVQALPLETRVELVGMARQLFESQNPVQSQAELRLAVLGYTLGEFKEYMSSKYGSLREVQDAVALVTTYMANVLKVRDRKAWAQMVLQTLGIDGVYAKETSATQLEHAVAEIHHGTSLFAPMIIKAWLKDWDAIVAKQSPQEQQQSADVVWLMCAWLGTSKPKSLRQYYAA